MSNTPNRTKILNRLLAKERITYNQAKSTRDLGISYTAAASRPCEIFRSRLIKTRKRIAKTKQIANISRMAKKLYTGSCFSASTWGHQAAGVTPNEMIAIERNALACSGVSPIGRCRLVSLSVIYDPGGTPQARIVKDTIKFGFRSLHYILYKLITLIVHGLRLEDFWLHKANHINMLCLLCQM